MSATKRWAMVIDMERCIGCEACVIACDNENNPASDSWIDVETIGGQNGTPRGRYPELTINFQPKLCMHCEQPPCVEVCPTEGLLRREDGLVIVQEDACVTCPACMDACPYDAIKADPQSGLIEKCNLCAHRIDQGLEPFCVRCCAGQAMHFGDLNDPQSPLLRIIAERNAFTLIPEEGTHPSVYYCLPRDRQKL